MSAAAEAAQAPATGGLRRSNAMSFDTRVIRGETAGKGMIVLFNRGLRDLPALTERRTDFLSGTVNDVLRERSVQASEPASDPTVAARPPQPPGR